MDYSEIGELYSTNRVYGTDFLAFRDIPFLIQKHFPRKSDLSVLDYGCGAGLSTRFVKKSISEGSTVVGVDISKDMIKLASEKDIDGQYLLIEKEIPFPDESFHLIYCNFVFFELASLHQIIETLSEIKRVMKPEGHLIATTGTPALYDPKNDFVNIKNEYLENESLESGDVAKLTGVMEEGEILFHDYYWTEQDYRKCFSEVGLSLVSLDFPLGRKEDPIDWEWKDETKIAPYVTFSLKEISLSNSTTSKA